MDAFDISFMYMCGELIAFLMYSFVCYVNVAYCDVGAGSENRTRATRSEALHSTTKLYPQHKYILTQKIQIVYTKKKFF